MKKMMISNQDYASFLSELMASQFEDLSNRYGFHYYLNKNEALSDGTTRISMDDGVDFVSIGIKPLVEHPDGYIDEYDFVSGIVSVFHEKQHVHQYADWQKEDLVSKDLAFAYISCIGNAVYYQSNYFRNPCEVDAQYSGLVDAYSLFANQFGYEEANRLICLYQNERLQRFLDMGEKDFISFKSNKKFTAVDDILDEFDKAFEKSLHAQRAYDVQLGNTSGDLTAHYFSQKPGLYAVFEKEKDGARQDIMVSSFLFTEKSYFTYYKEQIPAIANTDLSVESAFKKPSFVQRIRGPQKEDLSERHHKNRLAELDSTFLTIHGYGSDGDGFSL